MSAIARHILLEDQPTIRLVLSEHAIDGGRSATDTVRQLIRDAVTFRRLLRNGQIGMDRGHGQTPISESNQALGRGPEIAPAGDTAGQSASR